MNLNIIQEKIDLRCATKFGEYSWGFKGGTKM